MANFDLKYNDYNSSFYKGLQSLLSTSEMSDITLAVEGKFFKAHQVILSLFSPYFRQLFTASPSKQSIFFMKNVKHHIMKDLLTFVYEGSVQIHSDDLNLFMETASELQIQGLADVGNLKNEAANEDEAEIDEPVALSEVLVDTTRKGNTSKRSAESSTTKIVTGKRSKKKALPEPIVCKVQIAEVDDEDDENDPLGTEAIQVGQSVDLEDATNDSEEHTDESVLVKVLRTKRGHTMIANNYQYYVRDRSVYWTTWCCARRHKLRKCHALLILSHDGRYFLKNSHNHGRFHPDSDLVDLPVVEERAYRHGTMEELNEWREELRRQNFQATTDA